MVLPSSPTIMISMYIDSKVRNNEQNMPYLPSLSKERKRNTSIQWERLCENFEGVTSLTKILLPVYPHTSPLCVLYPSASRVTFVSLYHLTHRVLWGSPEEECFAVTRTQFTIMQLSWKIMAGCLPYLNSGFIFCNMKINNSPTCLLWRLHGKMCLR